ncbi:MAG: metal-dependent hydrolase [Abitibacteriaceae bacterium]|nr:metal-dependent hydrolase [Abditibacteriaceae bacterium]
MTWRTHTLFGVSSLWLLTSFTNPSDLSNFAVLVACAVSGSLLPDLDAAESKIKHFSVGGIQAFAPLSNEIHQRLGHRGFLHSLLGSGLVGLLALPLLPVLGWSAWAAFLLGYLSHLVADGCTRSGVPLLHPRLIRYYLLPSWLRITTGSLAEEMLLPFLAIPVFLLLLSHLSVTEIMR